jgi:hypothetical protein
MKQNEIMEMAKQAGFNEQFADVEYDWPRFEAFAKLVAAKEREACAKVCDELPAPDIYNNTDKSMWEITCIDCADAIRARGQA